MLDLKEAISVILLFVIIVGGSLVPIFIYEKKYNNSKLFTIFWILFVLIATGLILKFFIIDFDAIDNPEKSSEYYKEEDRELKQLYPGDIDDDNFIARDINGTIIELPKDIKQNSLKFHDAEMNPSRYHIVKYTYDIYKGPLAVYRTEYRIVPK